MTEILLIPLRVL